MPHSVECACFFYGTAEHVTAGCSALVNKKYMKLLVVFAQSYISIFMYLYMYLGLYVCKQIAVKVEGKMVRTYIKTAGNKSRVR
jgi:hypothetical protein